MLSPELCRDGGSGRAAEPGWGLGLHQQALGRCLGGCRGKERAEFGEEIVNAPLLPILRDKSFPRPGAQINRLSVAQGGGWEHLYVPLWRLAV